MILSAVASPTPGSFISSSLVAELRSIFGAISLAAALAECFIAGFSEQQDGPRNYLRIQLKYVGRVPVVSGLKRISKPGLRVYAAKTDIPRVLGGLGVVIVSTSQGIMTGQQARRGQLGGEILAYVW